MMNKSFKNILMASVLAAGLAGCAAEGLHEPVWQLPGERHRITVKESMDRLNLVIGPGDAGLSTEQRNAVNALVGAWRDHGHGPVAISIPTGSANVQAAVTSAAQVREILYNAGLSWDDMAGGHYQAPGKVAPPVVLSFRRYLASAEGCSAAHQNLAFNPGNQASDNFGCAVQVNLAAMIADPHDLVAPKPMEPSSTDRRLATYEKYIEGESTGSDRSSDEEGTISDAVE